LTDIIVNAGQTPDIDATNKARDIINNAIMQELEHENSSTADIYENVLRRHIISNCQHLRVCLSTIENLMKLFNEHIDKKGDGIKI
jgi:hypothetical protein